MSTDEREFRIRPPAPKTKRQRPASGGWATAFKTVMHYARMSRRMVRGGAPNGGPLANRFRQRCAVRLTYSPNRISGQWKAHGKYISRDSATNQAEVEAGFSATADGVNLASTLDRWQSARDERLFKLILSPEFGERVDLKRFTRETMDRVATELSRKLEWCAVAHFNTEHPHVHVALRGKADGRALRIDREYIKVGLRAAAEDLCTAQMGFRTELDAMEAERREVDAQRFTSLDRVIGRPDQSAALATVPPTARHFVFTLASPGPQASRTRRVREQHVRARLVHLQKMGLAEPVGVDVWNVRCDFARVLRAMQRVQDRQRLLQVHGALISDERLPLVVTNLRRIPALDGRVLKHGEEDTGRQYLLLEGTDAKIHFIYHTPEVATSWANGKLRPNAFVRFRRMFGVDGRPFVEVADLGDAERLLRNNVHFRTLVGAESRQLPSPQPEQPWSGWLGRYRAATDKAREANTTRQLDPRHGRAR
jgi:hypothetical protein